MSAITRLIKELIEQNTYSEITATTGNANTVIISSISVTDGSYSPIPESSFIPIGGGYLKVLGDNYQENLNVFIGDNAVTTQFVSNTELNLVVPSLSENLYNLFIYNPDGSNAIKIKAVSIQGDDADYGWFSGGSQSNLGTTKGSIPGTLPTTVPYPGSASLRVTIPSSTTSTFNYIFSDKTNDYHYSAGQVATTIERMDFSNDTNLTDPRANLDTGRWKHASTSTQFIGYWSGNDRDATPFVDISLVGIRTARDMMSSSSRIIFNNDSASVSTRFNLSTARARHATTKNSVYSWFALGQKTTVSTDYFPAISSSERLDFANDSAAISTRGNAALARFDVTACSNENYGWYSGGNETYSYPLASAVNVNTSRIDRIDFSSDTNTFLVRGDLEESVSEMGSWATNSYGWFIGGQKTQNLNGSDKVGFSTSLTAGTKYESDSPYAPTSPNGPGTPHNFVFDNNSTLYNPRSNISRLDFSNDVVNAIVRAPVTNISQIATVQNLNYGWFSGGFSIESPNSPSYFSAFNPPSSNFQNVDTPIPVTISTASPTTTLVSAPAQTLFGPSLTVSSVRVGRVFLNYDPAISSNIERFIFSSDTLSVTSRSDLVLPVSSGAGVSGKI